MRDWTWPEPAAERRPPCASSSSTPGSSSLKHALVDARADAGDDRRRAASSAGSPAAAPAVTPRRCRRRSPTPAVARTRSATASCTAARASTGRRGSTTACARRSRRSRRSRRCTPAPRWRGSTPRRAALPRLPQVACFDTAFHRTLPAGGRDVRPAARVERALRAAPLRLSRAQRRVVPRAGARAILGRERLPAARRLPSRQRLLGQRGARRPLGRHDDGLHAAGGRADGHALGLDRPGRAAAPARGGHRARASSTTRSTTARGCSGSPAWPGCARSSTPRGGRRARARSRSTCSCAASARAVAAMTTSLRGLDALVFTGGAGERSARAARRGLRAPGSARRRARRRAQRRRTPSAISRDGAPSRCSSCRPARRSSSRGRPRTRRARHADRQPRQRQEQPR